MKYIITLFILFSPVLIYSQVSHIPPDSLDTEQQEVLNIIIQLFDGMREADSSKVHSVFGNSPTLYTSYINKQGKAVLHKGSGLQHFLNAVGTPHDEVWDEPLWNIKIHVDSHLAHVWADYAFYIGNSFSHCGVDALMLHKGDNGWKIFHLTDTRRKENCSIPSEIRKGRQ